MGWKDRAQRVAQNDAKPSWRDRAEPVQAEPQRPGLLDRFNALFTPEAKKEVESIQAERAAEADKQRAEGTTLGQTELEHTGNALTFGYLPQIEAGVQTLGGADYLQARDENIKRMEAQAQAHPVNAAAGDVAGTAANAYLVPLPTLGAGKGIIGGALKGAQYGALQGAVQNPGDVEGEINPLQLDERLQNAKEGAKFGGIVGGAAATGQKIAQFAEKTGKRMKGAGETTAFKSSGSMLKDFRQAAGKDEVNKIGRFMLDEGMVKAGDSFESVAEKANKINQEAGQKLDQIYTKAVKASGDAAESMPGFNPYRDKAQILEAVKQDLGDAPGATAIVKKVDAYIEGLAKKFGDKVLDPRAANDIKSLIDREINYARNPLNAKPKTEKAYSTMRRYLEDKVFQQVEYLGKKAGGSGLGKVLRETNQRYGMSKRIGDIAADRMNRVNANNAFGLTDRIAGGAGAVVGGAAAAASGERDPVDMGAKAVGAGILAAAGNHVLGKYGNAMLARGLDRTGGLLADTGQAGQALLGSPGQLGRIGVGLKRRKRPGLIEQPPGLIAPPVTEGYEQ